MLKQALILAGGKGTRLQNVLGPAKPKCLIDIFGKPLLRHQINACLDAGITDIIIASNHLHDEIERYLSNENLLGGPCRLVKDGALKGTAGALFNALPYLETEFLVIYGDLLFEFDFISFYANHVANCADVTIVVHPNDHPYDSDLVKVDTDNKVTSFFRPSKRENYRNLVNAAIYCINKKVLEDLEEVEGDIIQDIFKTLIVNRNSIYAYNTPEYIKDIGTPSRIHEALEAYSKEIPQLRKNSTKKPCLFLDRDGVINNFCGYLTHIDQFQLKDGIGELIRYANKSGLLVAVVTNQPVIARGDITFEGLREIHNHMEKQLGEQGCYLDDLIFCPHHPDKGFEGEITELKITCSCRKPKPGMINSLIKKYNIDASRSWLIGDSETDIQAARSAGVNSMLITDNFITTNIITDANLIIPNLQYAEKFLKEFYDDEQNAASS